MTIMKLSPMQRDDINRDQSDNLKSYVNDGFELTNEHIDNLEKNMSAQFKSVETRFKGVDEQFKETNEHIDGVEIKVNNLEKAVNTRFKETNERIDNLETKMGAQFKELKEDISGLTKLVTKIAAKIL